MEGQSGTPPFSDRRQDCLAAPFCLFSLLLFLLLLLTPNLSLAGSAWSTAMGQSRDCSWNWRAAEPPGYPDRDADSNSTCQADYEVRDYACLPTLQSPDCLPESYRLLFSIRQRVKFRQSYQKFGSRSPPPLLQFS